jgi:multiple sugar transport system permease protein
MKKHIFSSVVYQMVCLFLCCVTLYPLVWLFGSSLTESSQVFVESYRIFPEKLVFSNYVTGWRGFGGVSFGVFYKNTAFITVVATFGSLASSSLVAFGLSRIRFKGRNLIFTTMILSMLLPGQVLMVPTYIIYYKLGWVHTYLPLTFTAYLASPFYVFLMMQFIKGIPKELDEAATLDGCNTFTLYLYVIMPLLKPALVTAGIFMFFSKWNDFMGPLLYISNIHKYTLSLALRSFSDPLALTDWGAMFAMQFLSLIPCFILFIIFQKKITGGIHTTGLKG